MENKQEKGGLNKKSEADFVYTAATGSHFTFVNSLGFRILWILRKRNVSGISH